MDSDRVSNSSDASSTDNSDSITLHSSSQEPDDAQHMVIESDDSFIDDSESISYSYVEDDPHYKEDIVRPTYFTYAMPNMCERRCSQNLTARLAFYADAMSLPMCLGCGVPTRECCIECVIMKLHLARPLCTPCEKLGDMCPHH